MARRAIECPALDNASDFRAFNNGAVVAGLAPGVGGVIVAPKGVECTDGFRAAATWLRGEGMVFPMEAGHHIAAGAWEGFAVHWMVPDKIDIEASC